MVSNSFTILVEDKNGEQSSVRGSVAHHKPNVDRVAPQGALMNWIINEGVAKKTTSKQRQMGGHIPPTLHLQSQCRR